MLSKQKRFLIISDLQIPFEAKGALSFCRAIQKEYRTTDVICVGDETDHYFGSLFKKNPDANYSIMQEIEATKQKLRAWYRAFPSMKLCISNHGLRWAKKAFEAEIPSQLVRDYQEIIEAPAGWEWRMEWNFPKLRHPFRVIHGMGYSGFQGARNAALDSRISTVIGHLHSHAGVSFVCQQGFDKTIWGMNVGALIDVNSYAFEYGKYARSKPTLGIGVVLDEGKLPIFIPFTG